MHKGVEYDRTQAYFSYMNPYKVYFITRVFSLNIEKHHNFKLAYSNV